MIKYLGSKRWMLPALLEQIDALPFRARTVLDLFSGTSRVGHACKRHGLVVTSNDHNRYAHTLATCYVQADERRWRPEVERLVAELQALPGRAGFFTHHYCKMARFFQPKNGARIDAMRAQIARWSLAPELEAILLVSLMEAADRVDSTTGIQMAYLRDWAPRAHNDIELRVPAMLPGEGKATCLDARAAAELHEVDVAYLDPPYNQHSYLGNYHIWETLVRWDRPEVYGVVHKRTDVRERASPFNRKGQAKAAMQAVVEAVRARALLVSFNDEGYLSREELVSMLSSRGAVSVHTFENKRYVGAQIGIHNLRGEKVGSVGRLRNQEFLFVVVQNEQGKA